MRARIRYTLVAVAAALLAGPPAIAQEQTDDEVVDALATELAKRLDRDAASAKFANEAARAFTDRDLDAAEAALRKQIEVDPDNFVPHYNLACALTAQDRLEEAAGALSRAVELGFISRAQLERDPWLRGLRGTPFYERLLDNWPAVIAARREAQVRQAEAWLDRAVERTVVEDLRLDVLSAHDPGSTELAIEDLRRVARFARSVAPELFAARADDPWVLVVLPERRDFLQWAVATFGPQARRALAGIGGAYEHDQKRLVAQDLGATLRHEFFHVLHWRAMDRLGQVHPIWIQEGLASLVEDLDPVAPGSDELEPAPSWRTNIVKRLAEARRLPSLEELAGLSHERFSTSRPLAQYAQARTLFLFLHERGLFGDWLRVYTGSDTDGFDADRSGLAALDKVVGLGREEGERLYRAWVATSLPEIVEEPGDARAQLGVALEPGDGDGPRIRVLPRAVRRATDLRLNDVITAIDGRPTRDTHEYLRVIADYAPGDKVTVSYRRGRLHGETDVTLVPVP